METIDYGKVNLTFEDGLATLTLNDPERLNAIGEEIVDGFLRGLQEIAKPRRRVRCVLIRAEGRGFCAGANLGARSAGLGKDQLPVFSRVESLFHPFIRRVRAIPQPVVVAVNGACVGIGLALALSADHLVASDDAYFMAPFKKLGSAPDSGLTWILPRAVGMALARRILLRAERLTAADAMVVGMVSEVTSADTLQSRAREAALEFATGPTVALSEMKALLNGSAGRDLDGQMEAESRAVTVTSRTKDNVAAIRAFGSKHTVVFEGE